MQIIKRTTPAFLPLYIAMALAATWDNCAAAGGIGTPKTSKHESFKPENFERIAVIVKPIQGQQQFFNSATGISASSGRSHHDQTQAERLVEQRFMRVLLGGGYTLVARTDLDAAMKEKGLDEANLTDEKLTQEAGKFLHVSAIMVVSVDDYKTTPMQRLVANNRPPGPFGNIGQQTATYYQVVASISARLVKIDDNMVMWTGDLSLNQAYGSQDQGGLILGAMSEAIATSYPPLNPPAAKKPSASANP
jgi:hypothetical protein